MIAWACAIMASLGVRSAPGSAGIGSGGAAWRDEAKARAAIVNATPRIKMGCIMAPVFDSHADRAQIESNVSVPGGVPNCEGDSRTTRSVGTRTRLSARIGNDLPERYDARST